MGAEDVRADQFGEGPVGGNVGDTPVRGEASGLFGGGDHGRGEHAQPGGSGHLRSGSRPGQLGLGGHVRNGFLGAEFGQSDLVDRGCAALDPGRGAGLGPQQESGDAGQVAGGSANSRGARLSH